MSLSRRPLASPTIKKVGWLKAQAELFGAPPIGVLKNAATQVGACPGNNNCYPYYIERDTSVWCYDSSTPEARCGPNQVALVRAGEPCRKATTERFKCGADQPCSRDVIDDEGSIDCGQCRDDDGDGVTTCDGDCNDTNTLEGFYTNPHQSEQCFNSNDDNCNGITDESPCCDGMDSDNDGVSTCDGDCDDTYDGVQFNCDECADEWGGQLNFEREWDNCMKQDGEFWIEEPTCRCSNKDPSPIIIDLAGDNFSLTNLRGGVRFDLDSNGHAEQLPWTTADADDAWLVLDRDGDGRITSGRELFGTYTEQPAGGVPNGFLALRLLDADSDGRITSADPRFSALRLWVDANHDASSQPAELHTLASKGVSSIATGYRETRRKDRYGNEFRYLGEAVIGGRKRHVYDVLLTAR